MRVNDAVSGAVLVLFALAVILYSRTFPTLHGQAYGPALFPTLIGAGLLGCGVALVVRGLSARRHGGELGAWLQSGGWLADARRRTDFALVIGATIAYVTLSGTVGFVPMSVAILWTLLVRLGTRAPAALLVALATTAALQLLFARVLLVPLPGGVLADVVR